MDQLMPIIARLRDDESGQDLVEYALIIVLIALAVSVGLFALQGGISGVFSDATAQVQSTEQPF